MSWVKITDEWFDGAEAEDLTDVAVLVHLSGLAYSSRHRTDGRIKRHAARRLWRAEDIDAAIAELVAVGWWSETEGGWQIEDWRGPIMSADEQERLRESNRIRQERHRRHVAGDHSMCDRCKAVRNAVTDGVTNTVSNAPPTRPDPTRNAVEGRRGADAATDGSAGAPPPGSAARGPEVYGIRPRIIVNGKEVAYGEEANH